MQELERKLGYRFRSGALLAEALRHSSYANEHRGAESVSNERLEFLGDSVLGFVDGGLAAASSLIHRVLLDCEREEVVEERRRDYKTVLQELVQREPNRTLVYRMAEESGPDHDKTFTFEVLLNGAVVGRGEGHSKKEAEQMAARTALERLE